MNKKSFDFGELVVGDNCITGVMKVGADVKIDIVKKIMETAKENFKDEPWAYISNRLNDYSLDLSVHRQAVEFGETLVAFAVVAYRRQTVVVSQLEKRSRDDSYEYKIFEDLDSATKWACDIVKQHKNKLN